MGDVMAIDDAFFERIRQLPRQDQQCVIDLVESLHWHRAKRLPDDPYGVYQDVISELQRAELERAQQRYRSKFPPPRP